MHEEGLFVCLIMKSLFRKHKKCFPEEFQSMLENFEQYITIEYIKFVKKIIEAVEILIDYEDSIANKNPINWDLFDNEIHSLYANFECHRFLNICVHYFSKALNDYLMHETIDSLITVHDSILAVLKENKDRGVFNSDSWKELNNLASEIISQDEKNRQRKSKQFIESKRHLHEFVLRIMNFIFLANFKDLPSVLQEMLSTFPENQDVRFAPTVRAAVAEIMNDENLFPKRVGEEYADYPDNKDTSLSKEIRFLKDCICYSKTAIIDYCEDENSITPWQVFQYLMEDLSEIADDLQHNSILWNQMVRAALYIIMKYKKRNKETIGEASSVEFKLFTNDDSDSYMKTSKCCKCELQ